MDKTAFLTRLTEALSFMDPADRVKTVQYYREILEDRIEDGLSEEDAVAGMEPVEQIAARLRSESGPAPKKKRSRWTTVLVIAGSPLWLPLLLAVGIVLLSLFLTVWAVILALFAAAAALSLCLVAGIGCLFLLLSSGYPLTGVFLLGAGMVNAALGIALFIPLLWLCRLLVRAMKWLFRAVRGRFFRRREETA